MLSQLARMYEQERMEEAALYRDAEPIWQPLRSIFDKLKRALPVFAYPKPLVLPKPTTDTC